MKKLFKVLFVAILAIAFAMPAMAEIKVSGYYRTQGVVTNTDDTSISFDGPNEEEESTSSAIDARLRWMITNQLNDNVKVVWFLENDATFGDAGKDGGPGGDRVATETKNLYLEFNVPDTMFSVKTGLQGLNPGYEGIILNDDWSAIKVNAKVSDTFDVNVFAAKPFEGNKQASDDTDLYGVEANFKLGNGAKLSADVLVLNNNNDTATPTGGAGDNTQLFDIGANVDATWYGVELSGLKAGGLELNGFLVAANAEDDPKTGEIDGMAASVQGKMGAAAARIIYMTGGGSGSTADSFPTNLGGNYDFAGENLAIFLTDAYYNNLAGGRMAINAATEFGVGLMALTAQYNTTISDYYLKTGFGYFMAEDDFSGLIEDDMGMEFGARFGKKIAEKVDASLNAHYAMLGDFWQIAPGVDPDDIYKINFMLNVGF